MADGVVDAVDGVARRVAEELHALSEHREQECNAPPETSSHAFVG